MSTTIESTAALRANSAPGPAEDAGGSERFLDTYLTTQVHFLTSRAGGRGIGHANQRLQELDLKVRQFSVLSLAASGMNPSQRELGEFLSLDPSQIVALVDQLEGRGAVRREADPRDRRSKIIVATPEGHQLHERACAILDEAEDESLATLSPRERKQLRALLLKVAF